MPDPDNPNDYDDAKFVQSTMVLRDTMGTLLDDVWASGVTVSDIRTELTDIVNEWVHDKR